MATKTLPKGFVGAQADMTPSSMISRTVEDAAGIAMGLPVSQGTNDRGIVTGAAEFVGITVDEYAEGGAFEQYDQARLMTEGTIWVTAAGTVAAGDPVTYQAGWKTGGTTGRVLTDARYETSGVSGDLVVIRLWGAGNIANS